MSRVTSHPHYEQGRYHVGFLDEFCRHRANAPEDSPFRVGRKDRG
jgi:hypothetical protein